MRVFLSSLLLAGGCGTSVLGGGDPVDRGVTVPEVQSAGVDPRKTYAIERCRPVLERSVCFNGCNPETLECLALPPGEVLPLSVDFRGGSPVYGKVYYLNPCDPQGRPFSQAPTYLWVPPPKRAE